MQISSRFRFAITWLFLVAILLTHNMSAKVMSGLDQARIIWAQGDTDASGRVSIDGRLLTYIDWSSGDVGVRNLETGINRRITNNQAYSKGESAGPGVISPAMTQVMYVWRKLDAGELRLVSIEGGLLRYLLQTGM